MNFENGSQRAEESNLGVEREVSVSKCHRSCHRKEVHRLQRATDINKNGAGHEYVNLVDLKYSGIEHEVKKKLAFQADLLVLEPKSNVDSYESYKKEKGSARK